MHPDRITVTFQREGPHVTARTTGPSPRPDDPGYPYAHLIEPLRQRGLTCSVEYGLSDRIVRADLPDGSVLIISPPQEPATNHPPGYPGGWTATRGHPHDAFPHDVLYDSEPGGSDSRYGGSIAPLLARIDIRLDQLGLPPRPEPGPDWGRGADAALHRAGFVPVVFREFYHRLPTGMTDPHEQRQAVTRAVGIVRGEGFDVSCDPRLLDRSLPVRTHDELSAGSRIGSLSRTITTAGHTREVVAALSELTAPADGVLHAVADVLNATADWWQGLGEPADPHYANRLRYLTKQLDTYALEIRSLRGDLADRHTGHPQREQGAAVRHAPTAPGEAIRRAQAAAASSPSRAGTRAPATPSAVTLLGSTTPAAHRRR